ncbi:hypothetical protein ACOI1C_19520 [Bacillus sp. DJP31]|uniref:hypothetical protein n=1 Tax=Bacillus sp. DJP31 TaxID=3409789 RepID=UPI003BB69B3A
MLKEIRELLTINKTLPIKENHLNELEEKLQNKEKLIDEIILQTKASFQAEREQILLKAKIEAGTIQENTKKELKELTSKKEVLDLQILSLEEELSSKRTE